MNLYPLLVFVHVLGAIGIFAAVAIEAVSLGRLQGAETPAEVQTWMSPLALPFRLGPLAMLTTLVSGMWMMVVGWGRQPWLVGAFVGLVGMGLLGGLVSLRGIRRLRAALASETGSELLNVFRSVRSGNALKASLRLRMAIGVAILGLMTFKPDAAGSLLLLATGTLVGLVASTIVHDSSHSRSNRVTPGAVLTERHLVAISGEPVRIPEPDRLVHLQFRRFAGCPVCNLHLRSVVLRHDELAAAGVREVVVFHSNAEELRAHAAELPFAVIADPDKQLYAEFGVESAPRALLDPRVWLTILRAVIRSLIAIARGRERVPAANPHGGRLGLPADFLISRDGLVLASKYGRHAYEQWSVDEILALARASQGAPPVLDSASMPSQATPRGRGGLVSTT